MTTRRNFLKTGSISLAGLLVGEKVYSAVSTPDNKKSFSTIASKVTGDRKSTRLNSSHANESRMPSSA